MTTKDWNKRYAQEEYIYGKSPNCFFKQTLNELKPGRVLLPADGEARNGVYAATKGWIVDSFDQSPEAKVKALALAKEFEVDINYKVLELDELYDEYPAGYFDVIAILYLHIPQELRENCFPRLLDFLKPGGSLVFECFSKEQVKFQEMNPQAGGPRNRPDLLYSTTELAQLFQSLKPVILEEKTIFRNDGEAHCGEASVIRFIGKK